MYVENIESYWAIIIPLAFAVNTPDKAFKRQAQLKVNDIAASQERGGGAEMVRPRRTEKRGRAHSGHRRRRRR